MATNYPDSNYSDDASSCDEKKAESFAASEKTESFDDIINAATVEGFDSKFNPDTGIASFKFECPQLMCTGKTFSAIVTITKTENGAELSFFAEGLEGGGSTQTSAREVLAFLKKYKSCVTPDRNKFPALDQELDAADVFERLFVPPMTFDEDLRS